MFSNGNFIYGCEIMNQSFSSNASKRVAIIMGGFGEGGIDIVFLALASGMIALGVEVDFVFASHDTTDRRHNIPREAGVFHVSNNAWFSIPGLIKYFRDRKPDMAITAVSEIDFNALVARKLSGVGKLCRMICTIHTHITTHMNQAKMRPRLKQWMAERVYFLADHLVAVSRGVGADMEERLGLVDGSIITIYNPVWSKEKELKSKEKCPLAWLTSSPVPVVIAAGRLNPQKNFPNLLRAFAILRKKTPLRLLILGEGEERLALEKLASELGIKEDLQMPGFVANPLAYFSSASLYVMSSSWEGLPTVLIEALGCGLPIVSTDCKSGPSEILEHGKLGELVPINDSNALAAAMEKVLTNPPPRELLLQRATFFSEEASAGKYLELLKCDS